MGVRGRPGSARLPRALGAGPPRLVMTYACHRAAPERATDTGAPTLTFLSFFSTRPLFLGGVKRFPGGQGHSHSQQSRSRGGCRAFWGSSSEGPEPGGLWGRPATGRPNMGHRPSRAVASWPFRRRPWRRPAECMLEPWAFIRSHCPSASAEKSKPSIRGHLCAWGSATLASPRPAVCWSLHSRTAPSLSPHL